MRDFLKNLMVAKPTIVGWFKTDPVPWVDVEFAEGWAEAGGTAQIVQCRRVGNRVEVRGQVLLLEAATVGPDKLVFSLPNSLRPSAMLLFSAPYLSESLTEPTTLITAVRASGDVSIFGAAPASSLIGFNFSFEI